MVSRYKGVKEMTLIGSGFSAEEFNKRLQEQREGEKETPEKEEEVRNEPEHVLTPAKPPSQQ
jgi:hypothetical protein